MAHGLAVLTPHDAVPPVDIQSVSKSYAVDGAIVQALNNITCAHV